MAQTIHEHMYSVDINEPLIRRFVGLLGNRDVNANRFGARLTRDGADADITGYSVRGYFIRPDESTVLVNGVIDGNLVYVDMPENCYYYNGACTVSIKISNEDITQTVLICDSIICQTTTDEVIEGEYKILSVAEIAEKMAEVDAAAKEASRVAKEADTIAKEAAEITEELRSGLENGEFNGEDGVGIASVSVTKSPDENGFYYINLNLTDGQHQVIPYKHGADGNGIASTVMNADYTLTFEYTDGTSYTTPSIRGATGATGGTGAAGKDGSSVTVKSVSESTADGGSNVVTFSDGKTMTVKNGSKGSKGDTGSAGSAGKDGVSVTHSWNGTTLTVTSASGTSSADLKGATGAAGKDGQDGATGQRGTGVLKITTAPSSYTTATGGFTPTYRVSLSTVKTQAKVDNVLVGDTVLYSYYTYPVGYVDASYVYLGTRVSIRGSAGAAGAAGADGVSAEHSWSGTTLTVTSASGTSSADLKGDPGDDYVLTAGDRAEIEAEIKATSIQQTPLFAQSVDGCTDTSKVYVLPDGYIYGYISVPGVEPEITIESKSGGYWAFDEPNNRFVWSALSNYYGKLSNKIPVTAGDQLSYKGKIMYGSNKSVIWFNSAGTVISSAKLDAQSAATTLTAPAGATAVQFNSHNEGKEATLEIKWILCQAAAPAYRWASTNHAFVPADYEERILALEQNGASGGGVLYGKKYVACGDSFTEGPFASKTDETWDSDWGVYKTYPYWIAKRNGMTLINEAKSGSDFTNASGANNPFSVSRYQAVPKDADYITLMFGLNETGVAIGSKTDTTNATLWGAYNIVFEYFLTNMPFAKIGVIIADAWMTETYANAVKEICKYWGIPYLDLKGDQVPLGIGGKYSETASKAQTLRNAAFQTSSSDQHPNPAAHKYRSTIIENFLRSL